MRTHKVADGSRPDGGQGIGRRTIEPSAGVTEIPERTYITGITVTIAGILSFFMALISAYIVRRGSPAEDWRDVSVPRILWLGTAILVLSMCTLSRSRKCFRAGDESGFQHWWTVTAILGLFFLASQLIAWRQLALAKIYLSTNPSSSFFYLLTAAHGVYVLGGVVALFMVEFRANRHISPGIATRVVPIYWHFVAAVWICLFLLFILGQ